MRLREDVPCKNDDVSAEKEELIEKDLTLPQNQWCPVLNAGFSSPKRLVVVGYALTTKKIKSFLQPKLEGLARNKGILFVAIDHNRPLSDQGPFDIVLHKLSGKEWRQVLELVLFLYAFDANWDEERKRWKGWSTTSFFNLLSDIICRVFVRYLSL